MKGPLRRAFRTKRISRRRHAAILLSHYKITPACSWRALARLKDLSAALLAAGLRVGKGRRAFFRRCREALLQHPKRRRRIVRKLEKV